MYNVLLEIDGSADGLAALDIGLSLTRSSPQVIVYPHHVVDTQAIWKLLGMEKPGLVGSGPYFQAFDSFKSALYELIETINESYQARCGHLEQFANIAIDEGDFVSRVRDRAAALKALVLVGKSTLLRNAEATKMTISEISDDIHFPLIVVDQAALLCGCGCFRVLSAEPGQCCTQMIPPQTLADLLTAASQSSQTEAPIAA